MRKYVYLAACMTAVLFLTACAGGRKYEYREEGVARLNAGNYPAAVSLFNQALDESDGMVGDFELDVLKYRAEAEYGMEDYAAAAETYDILWQVTEEDQKQGFLSRCCAMLLLDGSLEEAKEKYQTLYAQNRGGADTLKLLQALGAALREAGKPDEATELYQQAVDDGAANGELYNMLALNELEFGEYDQALAFIEKGLAASDGAREKLLYNKAVAYERKLDFAGALAIFEDYAREFGASADIEKEIAFLRTRAD